MRLNGWTGIAEDDMTRLFPGSPWLISTGDIWRWRAAVESLRELDDQR